MSPNVLVIEPFADLRLGITETLRREHLACNAVATAAEAAAELGMRAYTHVVVDLHSTGDFAASLDPSSRVILLTEDDSYSGSFPTLRKPFSRAELISRVTS